MKQTLENFISRFSKISQIVNEESDLTTDLYDMTGLVSGRVLFEAALSEPTPAARALRTFLKGLPEDILYSILVLMYSGRDDEEDVLNNVSYLSTFLFHKERAVNALCEKRPRMEYIEKGIQYLGADNLDVLLESVRE